MTTITVQPVREDLSFGARVGGVDTAALDDPGLRAEIVDLFEQHGLLIFEGVDPTPRSQVALSNVFGPLKDHPSQAVHRAGGDDMLGVIEMRHEPNAPGRIEIDGTPMSSWLPWHFDHCYNDQLNRAGVLRCVEGPTDTGLTGFVDGIALYHAISPAARECAASRAPASRTPRCAPASTNCSSSTGCSCSRTSSRRPRCRSR